MPEMGKLEVHISRILFGYRDYDTSHDEIDVEAELVLLREEAREVEKELREIKAAVGPYVQLVKMANGTHQAILRRKYARSS